MLIFSGLTFFKSPTQGTTQDKKCVCERTIAKLQNTGHRCFFYIDLYKKLKSAVRNVVHFKQTEYQCLLYDDSTIEIVRS